MEEIKEEIRILNKYISRLHRKELAMIGVGSQKYCYAAGENKVLLKYREKIVKREDFLRTINQAHIDLKNLSNHLHCNLPQMVQCDLTKNDNYYELQEKAKGRCLAWYSEEETLFKVFGEEKANSKYEALSEDDKWLVGGKVYTHNRMMQKHLLDKTYKYLFMDFLRDYKWLMNNGYQIDNHAENIFFDKERGFTFIDLNPTIYEPVKYKSDDFVILEIFQIFDGFNKFTPYMEPKKAELIKSGTKKLKALAMVLAQEVGYKFSPRFIDYYSQVLNAKLRTSSIQVVGV